MEVKNLKRKMKNDNVKLRGNNVALRKEKFKKEFKNRVHHKERL